MIGNAVLLRAVTLVATLSIAGEWLSTTAAPEGRKGGEARAVPSSVRPTR